MGSDPAKDIDEEQLRIARSGLRWRRIQVVGAAVLGTATLVVALIAVLGETSSSSPLTASTGFPGGRVPTPLGVGLMSTSDVVASDTGSELRLSIGLRPTGLATELEPQSLTVRPGAPIEVLVEVYNGGPSVAENVSLRLDVPTQLTYVADSGLIRNANHPDGIAHESDAFASNGVDIGDYGPDSNAWVTAELEVGFEFACGTTTLPVAVFYYDAEPRVWVSRTEATVVVDRRC